MTEAGHVAAARAVYDASAERSVAFAGAEIGPVTEGPLDRALLSAFVELAGTQAGRVADVADALRR